MTTFVIVIRWEEYHGIGKAREIIEGLPTFKNVFDGGFDRLVGKSVEINTPESGMEVGILAYEFPQDEDEFLYLRKQIEETILSGSVSYFQRDIFGHLHQLA